MDESAISTGRDTVAFAHPFVTAVKTYFSSYLSVSFIFYFISRTEKLIKLWVVRQKRPADRAPEVRLPAVFRS